MVCLVEDSQQGVELVENDPKIKPRIESFSYWTPSVEFQEPIPSSTNGQACASLSVPTDSPPGQIEGIIQRFIRLQEESKESTERIAMIEKDIECIKLELAKMQTEWHSRQQQALTEWSETKGQPDELCSEEAMQTMHLDRPRKYKMLNETTQAQNLTCRQRKDDSMRDEADYPCYLLPQFGDSGRMELMPFTDGHCDRECVSALPFCSLPHRPSRLTSVTSYTSYRRGSLLYRFKADVRSDRPLKAYAPRSNLDLKIGHKVKVILPTGKVGVGVLKYVGALPGVPEVCFGVELEVAASGLRNGVFAGCCYFQCKPGQGVFVNFSKILMIFE
ncbi:uncharacterized protein LOC144606775 isoform X2 [Rhinoraja longicauda]